MNDESASANEADRMAEREKPPSPSNPDIAAGEIRENAERDVTEYVVGRARVRATPVDTRSLSGGRQVTRDIRVATERTTLRIDPEVPRGWNVAGRMDVVDYVFGAIHLLMTARLLLALADATGSVARLVDALSDPLYAPFRALVRVPTTEPGQTLALPILIALVSYMLVHASISGLMRLTRLMRKRRPRT